MHCIDENGNDVAVLSDPTEIATEMNKQALQQGFPLAYPYYLFSEDNTKSVISNVPKSIYNELKLKKYIPPQRINKNTREILDYLLEFIDLTQNSDPIGQPKFPDYKEFQLNRCYHNSTSLFKLIDYLKLKGYLPSHIKSKIVLGYISRKIPNRSQFWSLGIVNDSLWMHDWHIWNYVNNIIVDMTVFSHGNILPSGGEIVSWGRAEDHVIINLPKCLEYKGCVFSNLSQFNEVVGNIIGFK